MAESEKRLEAMSNRGKLQETWHDWPYPLEWDAVEYPSKFKVPSLHYFDGKGSPSQHLFYFWAQTGNIVKNNAVLTWLFDNSRKGLAFDWFRKLPPGSIKAFSDLESFFLTKFFDDDLEDSLLVLFSTSKTRMSQLVL